MIVQAEADAGEIEHAIQLVLDYAINGQGFIAPAINGDGGQSPGVMREGLRAAIPPGTPMPLGLSPLGQKVFRALVKYGAYDIDTAGGTTNMRVQSNGYTQSTVDALYNDMHLLIPMLQLVK